MKTASSILIASRCLAAAGVGLFLATAVHADTLNFNKTPASNAAAELNRRYGITIVFKGAVNGNTPVTFSVDDAMTPGGRLQAVNDLAYALNLDFQKVFVVSKIDPGTTVPAVKIDSEAPVVFTATKLPAREAIRTVAAVDGAIVQISRLVQGSVVFPNRSTTTQDAAASIARQTQTVWKAYYGLFPRGQGPSNLDSSAPGATGDGDTAFPLVSFRKSGSHDVPISGFPDANTGIALPLTGAEAVTTVGNPDVPFNNPYDYPPFGYSGLGYDPYGYFSPYGYPGYGYTVPGSPAVPVPGTPTPTAPVTTVPPTNTTVLPNYPFTGNLGGSVNVGGY